MLRSTRPLRADGSVTLITSVTLRIRMERVEIPMPAEMVDALGDVAAEEYTNNRSAAVRDAVSELLKEHGRKQE